MRVITISRQCGAGGRELGKRLADRLGIECYDRQLIQMIAAKGQISEAELEAYDRAELDEALPMRERIALSQRIYTAQRQVIKSLAKKGPCVIVGRCAGVIWPGALRLFVFASEEDRARRMMAAHPLMDKAQALEQLRKVDARRKSYHEYYSTLEWEDPQGYDLCLNTGRLGMEGCLQAVLACLEVGRGIKEKK